MFLTLDDARVELARYLDPPRIEEAAALLSPVTALIAADDAPPGGHQIGGLPRAGADFVWPAVDEAALFATTLRAGHPDANAANRAHLDAGIPMSFVARIELSALDRTGGLSALPDQGRLLFFYDFMIGSYESTAQTGRVIWDRAEAAEIRDIPLPAALSRAAGQARDETRALNAEFGTGEDWDGFGTVFETAARPARITQGVELPSPYMLQAGAAPADLVAAIRGQTDDDEAHDLRDQYEEAYYALMPEDAPVLRLLSLAVPEQDDPRYNAVVTTRFGKEFLSHEEWQQHHDQIDAGAAEWVTLAQLDIAAWLQDNAEGQVYFLIRAEDLAARHFDRVVAVYQQT
ncbi:MAG: DUF1963 domain-containing protein [Paracoccus sp. (in: a-proteobacteria)]|nr:DUF1963 domain-containing protein [Paracoccus sp. (in: a-proteobacteria)]